MKVDVNWVRTVYSNGRGWHVGNMVRWKGVYYILHAVLPSGGDTGYGGILPVSDNQALIAYYSSHE